MAPEYQIQVKTRAGVRTHIVTDFLSCQYTRQVNAPGLCAIEVAGSHSLIDSLEWDSQIEVMRRDAARSIHWYIDFRGLYVDCERYYTDSNAERFILYCPGQMDFLAREIVAWAAGTADRTEFTGDPAETILKTLVQYNATSDATTGNGRIRTTDLDNITVEADGAGGSSITVYCAHRNLLETLQDVARIGGGDFDLVNTGTAGSPAWEFRWYAGQLGTDRTATVQFSIPAGNMAYPRLRRNRMQERTVAVVGGQGEESARAFVTRTGTNYNATYNSRVVFFPATNYETTAGLQNAGDQRLDELEAKDEITFGMLQVPSTLYGSHYYLGDKVTAYAFGQTFTQKIMGVLVTVAPGAERVEQVEVMLENA